LNQKIEAVEPEIGDTVCPIKGKREGFRGGVWGETRRVAEYLTAQRRDDPEEEKEKTIQKPGKGMVRAS
jgi:hypothetical protein